MACGDDHLKEVNYQGGREREGSGRAERERERERREDVKSE